MTGINTYLRLIFLTTDPDIITLLSSSYCPISPVVLPDQSPNPLVDKFFHSLTANPIQLTTNPTVPQHKSRTNILLPALFDSQAHSDNIQSEESQSPSPSPRRQPSKSKVLTASTQHARASLRRPNRFQTNQHVSKQKRKESYYHRHKSARRPRYKPYLHYQLTNAISSWEIVFWDSRRQEYAIQNTALSSQRLVVPLTAIEVQPDE